MSWTFNFDEADEVHPFTIVPIGQYEAMITNYTIETTAAGEAMPRIELTIDNGEYAGQMLFDRWYMPNRGKQQDKAYRKTLGFMKMRLEAIFARPMGGNNDLSVLLPDMRNRRVLVSVGIRPSRPRLNDDGTEIWINGKQQFYPEQNEVSWYFPLQATGAQVAQQVPMGIPMTMTPPAPAPAPSAVIPPQGNGGAPQAPQPSPAPSPQPTPTASQPTQPAPATAPSAPEAPGEDDMSNTFRL
jgi:hypothetical protein